MNLQRVNEIIAAFLESAPLPKGLKLISSDVSSDYNEEKDQGEEGLKVEIWDVGEATFFLKVRYATNSYGYDEHIKEIKFVTATEQTEITYD